MKSALQRYNSYAIESSLWAWRYFQACIHLMNDELREQVHNELAPCTDREFLERYSDLHFNKFNEHFVCE